MTWIRLDDGFLSHKKTLALPHKSIVLHIAGLTYCACQLTDGEIPKTAMSLVYASARVTRSALDPLLSAAMWRDQGDHYMIHDYLHYQESRDAVLERRAKWAKKKQHQRHPSPGESTGDTPGESTGVSHAPIPTHPIPSHPPRVQVVDSEPHPQHAFVDGAGQREQLGRVINGLFGTVDEAAS